jgi:MFS family permease
MTETGPSEPARPAIRVWLTRNLIALGLVSLFTDVASEMIIPLLPAFLTETLGQGAIALGIIEGAAEALSSVLKLVFGRIADRIGRDRPIVIGGYLISSIAKPLFAFASSLPWVLAVRLLDRTGKGIRTSPRDALIARSVPEPYRGRAFGFHRAMDNAGAVIGPLVGALLVALLHRDLRRVFLFAAIPGVFTILALVFGLVERDGRQSGARGTKFTLHAPDRRLMRFLVPLAIFTLGNSTDTFLLLKAGELGAPLEVLPLLWGGLHVTKTVVSLIGGRISDSIGPRKTIAIGWLVYALIYGAFSLATTGIEIAVLFIVYGVYHGLTEGPERALVATIADGREKGDPRHGTVFGWYHLSIGVGALIANVLFGLLWDAYGSRAAFTSGVLFAIVGAISISILRPDRA